MVTHFVVKANRGTAVAEVNSTGINFIFGSLWGKVKCFVSYTCDGQFIVYLIAAFTYADP